LRPISIWQPSEKDGRPVWQRPEPELLGDHYADEQYLWPKTADSPTRICFFGESVAAGYLYAPHVTPAKVLGAQLDFAAGAERYEVIDLARTNEILAGLVETVDQAIQLDPDVLVIFAGNNWNLLETPEWSPYLPGVTGRRRYAEVLKAGGLESVIETAAKERLQKVWLALAEIGAIAAKAALPVVLVVPEVNLADWETCQPVHWLDGDDLAQWYSSLNQAQQALESQNWQGAAGLPGKCLIWMAACVLQLIDCWFRLIWGWAGSLWPGKRPKRKSAATIMRQWLFWQRPRLVRASRKFSDGRLPFMALRS
jgi:hypothetical protein